MDSSLLFQIGEKFESFEAITEKLNCYCNRAFVHYWTRDSRKINGTGSRVKRKVNPELKYYSLKYTCVLGGQAYRSRGLGKRYSLSIRASNCPAYISFRLTKDGQYLEVVSINNEHNHEQTEELFQALPRERKLADEVKSEILDLVQLQVDKERVKQYVKLVTQKVLTTKDLTNIIASGRIETRPNITPERSNELLAKIYHQEVEASMLGALDSENDAHPSSSIAASKAKKIRFCNSDYDVAVSSLEKGENAMQDSNVIFDCVVSEPTTETHHFESESEEFVEAASTTSVTYGVKLEDTSSDIATAVVVEDSEQYCITCGQNIPKR